MTSRSTTSTTDVELFLVAAPGLEAIVEQEARRVLGADRVERQAGGVRVVGDRGLIARANLYLRLPSRVLVRVGAFEARREGALRRGVASLPIARWLPRGARVSIRASATRSRLYHTGLLAEQAALGLEDAIGATVSDAPDAPDALLVLLRGEADRFTLSLDTSGELLHRRGWRTDGGEAPLRETLAAALLAFGGYDDGPLVDPMCGSGTIAIEAALVARRVAPGLDRRFAFERFAGHDEAAWQRLRDDARAEIRAEQPTILAADADASQLETAQKNAARAGMTLAFAHTPLDRLTPPATAGLFVTNAPYGKRVGAAEGSLPSLLGTLRRALGGPFGAWRAAVLVGDRRHVDAIGLREAHALQNGGLRTWLALRR